MKSSQTLNRLITDVEELLAELADEHDAQFNEITGRVEDALAAAKRSLAGGTESAVGRIGRYARLVDGYITGFPRLGFLTGMLVGGTVVYLSTVFDSKDNRD